jgi:hypothetical protein
MFQFRAPPGERHDWMGREACKFACELVDDLAVGRPNEEQTSEGEVLVEFECMLLLSNNRNRHLQYKLLLEDCHKISHLIL